MNHDHIDPHSFEAPSLIPNILEPSTSKQRLLTVKEESSAFWLVSSVKESEVDGMAPTSHDPAPLVYGGVPSNETMTLLSGGVYFAAVFLWFETKF